MLDLFVFSKYSKDQNYEIYFKNDSILIINNMKI